MPNSTNTQPLATTDPEFRAAVADLITEVLMLALSTKMAIWSMERDQIDAAEEAWSLALDAGDYGDEDWNVPVDRYTVVGHRLHRVGHSLDTMMRRIVEVSTGL